MADEGASVQADTKEVFQRSTMNRIASSDELDHYIKVTNPSAWAIILAALLLVGGVLIWAIVAVVPVTVNTTGVLLDNPESGGRHVVCWVDKTTADRIKETGARASIDGAETNDVELFDMPMSISEVMSYLGTDFYKESIELEDWNYMLTIDPSEEPKHTRYTIETSQGEAHLIPVSIITSEKNPITIVLGKK